MTKKEKELQEQNLNQYHKIQELIAENDILKKKNKDLNNCIENLRVHKNDYMLLDFILEHCKIKIGFEERINLFDYVLLDNLRYYVLIYEKANWHKSIKIYITKNMYNLLEKLGY